MLDFLVPIVNQ
uniref:Uncharacterized protein n=1 Tax=Arundo donax TaxID=35708 RepID=A0A0A9AGR5_ARUDO